MAVQEPIGKQRQVPGLVELNAHSGEVNLNRDALPRAAARIVFGWGLSGTVVPEVARKLSGSSPILVVVSKSAARTLKVSELIGRLMNGHVESLEIRGHADHAAIRAGIAAVRRTGAAVVVAIGGGTALDVGKSIAALAWQESGENVGAFQLGQQHVVPEKALKWIAIPTTSGTGSESSDNAVIELGDEKRSIRRIPPAGLIVSDPELIDSLPIRPTIVAAVDALAQSLEIFTNAGASREVQEVALAAFASLAEGIERLYAITKDRAGNLLNDAVDSITRGLLSWGSLLMGIAFAHARLGLPHTLVHFCSRFGLLHGIMVGILLTPGLVIQARDPETARRLARAAQLLHSSGLSSDKPELNPFLQWLNERITRLLTTVGLPCSLGAAGLTLSDLDWIVEREMANRPSWGIPARPATPCELEEVLRMAYSASGK